MFRKGGIIWTIWNFFVAALFVTLGVVTCVNSGNVDFQNVIILIAGILVIVDASLRLLTLALSIIANTEEETLRSQLGRAAASSSELAIGILLVLVSRGESAYLTVLFQYLAYFLGILLITLGCVALLFAIVFMVKKVGKTVANILSIVCGIILVTGGILILVYANQEALLQLFFIFFGILLILVGLALLMGTIVFIAQARAAAKLAKSVAKEAKESPNDNAIDGDVTEETPQDKPAPAAEEPKADEPKDEEPKNEENPANPEAE